MAVSPRGRPPSERDSLMLRNSPIRRTALILAISSALLLPAVTTAAPREHGNSVGASSPLAVLQSIWEAVRTLIGDSGGSQVGPDMDPNGVAGSSIHSGGADEGPHMDPNGVEGTTNSVDDEGDVGPHMDPNG